MPALSASMCGLGLVEPARSYSVDYEVLPRCGMETAGALLLCPTARCSSARFVVHVGLLITLETQINSLPDSGFLTPLLKLQISNISTSLQTFAVQSLLLISLCPLSVRGGIITLMQIVIFLQWLLPVVCMRAGVRQFTNRSLRHYLQFNKC